MEERMRALNKANLNLLRNILELREGEVTFKQVCQLVEALGGEVKQRRSSHTTITLDGYMVMLFQDQARELESGQLPAPQIKGGFFKPHGFSHSPGVIYKFNLSMVKDVFDNAKITLDKVKELEAKMDTQKKVCP